jgi:hypothetical protein
MTEYPHQRLLHKTKLANIGGIGSKKHNLAFFIIKLHVPRFFLFLPTVALSPAPSKNEKICYFWESLTLSKIALSKP